MNKKSLSERAHEVMHQIPSMPEHSEAENLNNRGGLSNQPLENRPFENKPLQGAQINHPGRDPKVLVSWQKKIGKFFGVEMR